MKLSDITCTAKFAHLVGLGAKRAQEDEEDTKKLKRAEEDEDKKESRRAEEDDEEKEAEDGTEDAEDEPEEDKKSRKAKRAKAEDDKKEDAEARGRRLERARAQAIFASPAAGIRPDIAAHLAFQTCLPSGEAIALLASVAAAAPRRNDLFERMATVKSPNVGVEGAEPHESRALAAQILAAGKKARGEA